MYNPITGEIIEMHSVNAEPVSSKACTTNNSYTNISNKAAKAVKVDRM